MGSEKITYITPSLYSSVMYWRKREDAELQELLDMLDHKPPQTTELMQAGIDFEAEVRKVCDSDCGYRSDDTVANEVAKIVNGALWQVPVKTEVEVVGRKILIFGRMDCLKRDWIYDIKRVAKYDLLKYYDSIQHLSYMKSTGLNNFKYLIKCGNSFYTETYHWDNTCEQLLQNRVAGFINWLHNIGQYDRYAEHWFVRGDK